MQYFYIKQGSSLPRLQMELIADGRYSFNKFHTAIQNATITFTMVNENTGVTKIAKRPAYIEKKPNTNCVEEYLICYDWNGKRDTNEKGNFIGTFTITFNEIQNDQDPTQPVSGDLVMPIREDLYIVVK